LLKKVVYINPSYALGYFELGIIHKKLHKDTDAKRYFKTAKELLVKEPKKSAEHLADSDASELIELIEKEMVAI
jgi:predicted metal-dependent hydrolase